jgi:hypothetical protein
MSSADGPAAQAIAGNMAAMPHAADFSPGLDNFISERYSELIFCLLGAG